MTKKSIVIVCGIGEHTLFGNYLSVSCEYMESTSIASRKIQRDLRKEKSQPIDNEHFWISSFFPLSGMREQTFGNSFYTERRKIAVDHKLGSDLTLLKLEEFGSVASCSHRCSTSLTAASPTGPSNGRLFLCVRDAITGFDKHEFSSLMVSDS